MARNGVAGAAASGGGDADGWLSAAKHCGFTRRAVGKYSGRSVAARAEREVGEGRGAGRDDGDAQWLHAREARTTTETEEAKRKSTGCGAVVVIFDGGVGRLIADPQTTAPSSSLSQAKVPERSTARADRRVGEGDGGGAAESSGCMRNTRRTT